MDAAIKNLSIDEKIALVEELWEEIDKERGHQLSDAQMQLLLDRRSEHEANPQSGISLDEFIKKHLS